MTVRPRERGPGAAIMPVSIATNEGGTATRRGRIYAFFGIIHSMISTAAATTTVHRPSASPWATAQIESWCSMRPSALSTRARPVASRILVDLDAQRAGQHGDREVFGMCADVVGMCADDAVFGDESVVRAVRRSRDPDRRAQHRPGSLLSSRERTTCRICPDWSRVLAVCARDQLAARRKDRRHGHQVLGRDACVTEREFEGDEFFAVHSDTAS